MTLLGQTWAMVVDAYRDLNSRKMFWIVLILSALVAGGAAAIGLTPTGARLLFWKIPFPTNSREVSNADFQKAIFTTVGVNIWLTWAAAILALISTADLFPSLISGGAIEMYLSRPISRLRLFLTKYLLGLLFVALQITCYSVAGFLTLGFRGHEWLPAIFLAIPLIVLFFSYLYGVCVLIGVATRSTVAAILLTLLFWVVVYAVHTTRVGLFVIKSMPQPTTMASSGGVAGASSREAEPSRSSAGLERAYQIVRHIDNVLPKTSQTVTLLQVKLGQVPKVIENANDSGQSEERAAMAKELYGQSATWTIGSSLLFEAVTVALAAWLFCRRDY